MATSSSSAKDTYVVTEKKALLIRLRKMGGQLRAIETLIETEADSAEILTQAISVRKALKSLCEVIIQDHLTINMEGASPTKEGQRRLKELLVVLRRYVD